MNGLNGVSNGHSAVSADGAVTKEKSKTSSSSHHHKSSSKDKHRDKERSDHKSSDHKSSEHKSSKGHSHSSSSKYVLISHFSMISCYMFMYSHF